MSKGSVFSLRSAIFVLLIALSIVRAFDDSGSFTIEFSEPQSNPDPPSPSCSVYPTPYDNIPPPIGVAIRDIDRGPGDPPMTSTQHSFVAAASIPHQWNTSSRYANISIHEVVGHIHSRGGYDVVVLEMNRLTTAVSTTIHPSDYIATREDLRYPARSNGRSSWSDQGGPITNTEFRAGTLDSVNHLFVTLIANRTSLLMLTFPSDSASADTSDATSVNNVRLPQDLPPLAHITGLQFDNFTQIFYGAAMSLSGQAYVLSLTPATLLETIYRDCSLPGKTRFPPRLCDQQSMIEFLVNGTRADFQRSAIMMVHHTITSATAVSLTAFDRASRVFLVIVMNGDELPTRPCADNFTSSFDLVGVRVTALFASQLQAFRVRLEGDAAVAMECDNLLGTCFLLRLRRKMFEYVKFSSVTGKVLRVLSAPTLRCSNLCSQGDVRSPHQFAVGVGSFDAWENRFLTLSIQDIAEMSPANKGLLDQFDSTVSRTYNASLSNLTASQVFNNASDVVKSLLAQRNSAYANFANIPPPLIPVRSSGGAATEIPAFPPTDEMSRVHTSVVGAKVNNLFTPDFLSTLGAIAEDEAAFIPPDPLEDKIFLDSSTYDANSSTKVVTMIAYEFSDKPYFYGTVGGVSIGNIRGGLPITVIGNHFQPSGFAVARWTDINSWFTYFASLQYLNKTHAVLVTPKIPTAVATVLQISNNGYIFSQPPAATATTGDEGFGFYEIVSRLPLSGSSVGRTGVILRGEFLRRVVQVNATCYFSSSESVAVQSRTEYSVELDIAVCFSPPISEASSPYIAQQFRVLVGYELIFQEIWFYVTERGPSILYAQFDPSLRTIVVQLQASSNLGSYNKSESCAKLFTIASQRFILTSTYVYWPQPFTFILLLDPVNRLRFNSILEISSGGDIVDALDSSLTLAGAIKFAPPAVIMAPTPVLSCPLRALSVNDLHISAHHSFGLLLQNVSFLWNVVAVFESGYSSSLNFTLVEESAIRISANTLSTIMFPRAATNPSVDVVAQFTVFFNGTSGKSPFGASDAFSNTSSNTSSLDPYLKNSSECSKFKTVQDAVKSNSPNCIAWPSVSSKCISKVVQLGAAPQIYIDRPFNSTLRVPSDSDVTFTSVVVDPSQTNSTFFIRWNVTINKSGLIHPQLMPSCAASSNTSGSCDLNVFISRKYDLALSGSTLLLPRNTLPAGTYDLTVTLFSVSNCSWVTVFQNTTAAQSPPDEQGDFGGSNGNGADPGDEFIPVDGGDASESDPGLGVVGEGQGVVPAMQYQCNETNLHYDTVNLQILSVHPSPITFINGAVSSGSPVFIDSGVLVCMQLDTVSSCNITEPTAFSESGYPNDPEFEDTQRSFTDTVSKSRQFLSSDAQDVVMFNSSQFIGMWCSRCNGSVSADILSLIDGLFGPQESSTDGGPSGGNTNPGDSPSPDLPGESPSPGPDTSPPPDLPPTDALLVSEEVPPSLNVPHTGDIPARQTASKHRFRDLSKIREGTPSLASLGDDPAFGFGLDVYVPTSNVSYTLEQVCIGEFDINTTHFAKNCSLFLNATRMLLRKYQNDSDPNGFSVQQNVLSVNSTLVCQYFQAYFKVLLQDPSVYSTRISPLYSLQWTCIIRPAGEPSSGYHSRNAYDTPCSNFTASSYYAAAIFNDKINASMVARISCNIVSSHVSFFLPVHAVMVLYPLPRNVALTQQRIPVNPTVSALTVENVAIQRAHLLRHSNTSAPYITFLSDPISSFSYASQVRWESRVPWLQDTSSVLQDAMFDSGGFLLNSQASVPTPLISLGFSYVFRVSHLFRGQLSGFSEVVVNMSAPFFQGKFSVSRQPSGQYRISTHRIEIDVGDRPLQFSFLQSLDFDLTLQPMGFSQTYSGPLYNSFEPEFNCSVVIVTKTASSITARSTVSASPSTLRPHPAPQVSDLQTILTQYQLGSKGFYHSSQMLLQTYRSLSITMSVTSVLSPSIVSDPSIVSIVTKGDLFEQCFLVPIIQLLSLHYHHSQESHQLFSPILGVNFTEILGPNSTTRFNFAVPGVQGFEHISAILFEGFRIFANGSIVSTASCSRVLAVIAPLVELNLPFSPTASGAFFGILSQCADADIQELSELIQRVLDQQNPPETSFADVTTNATTTSSSSTSSLDGTGAAGTTSNPATTSSPSSFVGTSAADTVASADSSSMPSNTLPPSSVGISSTSAFTDTNGSSATSSPLPFNGTSASGAAASADTAGSMSTASPSSLDPVSTSLPFESSVSETPSATDSTTAVGSTSSAAGMNPISLSYGLFHSNQRQLLQATPSLPPHIGSAASLVVANALFDFTAVCDRIRLASSTLGAPTYFSFPSAVVYARNFYTRTGVTVLETPQFMYQGVSCSSVSVQLQSKMPPDPKLDYHRSSICVSVSTKDFTPATLTVGGTIGITKISSSCSIMYKVYHGAYDRSKGLIETTVSLSFFTFSSVWARTKENKAMCQYYQGSTNSFSSNGIDSTFELLPNRTAANVCRISKSKPVFAITNNRVVCKFVISAASILPYSGFLGVFQETVDCTGAMSGLGTLCDGCDVCQGNGSTCRADCDYAVASGRKYDDCKFCGGSTFYYPSNANGLPWNQAIDGDSSSTGISAFEASYCQATHIVVYPPDPDNAVTQANVIVPRNRLDRVNFALDTTCFLMFEDLPSRIPVGIASVSGQNEYSITIEVIGGFIGKTREEVVEMHQNSSSCLDICDSNVLNASISYRNCLAVTAVAQRKDKCGDGSMPTCSCDDWSSGQIITLSGISFLRAPRPRPQFERSQFPEAGDPPLIYFSRERDIWVIPFNNKNTINQILTNSEPIPCDARTLQSLTNDAAWNAEKEGYATRIAIREPSKISQWTSQNKLLMRFTLKEIRSDVEWPIYSQKVMSFYIQPVNDIPRIITPSAAVLVSEDSLTPVPELFLFDDGSDNDVITVKFSLQRGFACSFDSLVASDNLVLEKIFARNIPVSGLDKFIKEFRLVSPDNIGIGNFDRVELTVTETKPAGFGDALTAVGVFYINYTAQSKPDIPAVFLSIPESQISLTENARYTFDGLGLGHISGTDSDGVRNGLPAASQQLKISCRGPFGVLFVANALQPTVSPSRRILGSTPAPSCWCESAVPPTAQLLALFPEAQSSGSGASRFCRDVIITGSVDQIEARAQSIVYSALRFDFSRLEVTGLVIAVVGPVGDRVNENKIFFSVNVLFSSNVQMGANVARTFSESWAILQRFSPPIPWAFEDVPARFQSSLSEFTSESAQQLYIITVSSRLNKVYIPAPYRDGVNFEVGSGLVPENTIVFQASTANIRDALLRIMYVSKKNYNTEFDGVAGSICIRQCYAFYPNSIAGRDSDCTSACKDTLSRYLLSKNRTSELVLDDLMVDINDLGSGGLGATRFSIKLHVPIFIAAINDGPCLSFLGAVFVNCFDSAGKEILSSPSFNFEMDEGTSLSISLGEFKIDDFDMFEKGNRACMNSSSVADAQVAASNGDLLAKLFLSGCPVIKVSISAARGLININFRSGMTIYEGSADQFTPSIKYFGSLEQVRQSVRNVRYKLSPTMSTFNYLAGVEAITVSVDDGGFSGADSVGEFENVASSSTIIVPVKILPINNPPVITLPSSSGGSFVFKENTFNVPLKNAVPSGARFSIADVDSDECGGVILVTMAVNIGNLDISFMSNQPILGRVQNLNPPIATYCNYISFSATNEDVAEILSSMVYLPPYFVNSEMLDPDFPALITVTASDRKAVDGSFNCGRQLSSTAAISQSNSLMIIQAINHAPYSSFSQSALGNNYFESPSLCGGRLFYSVMDPVIHSWKSYDAYVSNGAVDTSVVGTPAYLPGAEVGTDSDLSSCCDGTQWATIIRKGFIRQSFSALLAPEGLYSVQLSIIRPSPPATASSCEILIIHRNGTLVLNQLVRNTDIQAQQSWRQIKTASFLGSSCGYTQVDTFNSSFSCEVMVRSRGDGWGFAVDAVTLAFDGFQSIEGAPIQLRGFQAIDPDINAFSLASWASANAPLQLKVSLSVAHGLLLFHVSPAVMNVSTLVKMFPRGNCSSVGCFEDVCSLRFRISNISAPNCFDKGVVLLADCTVSQMVIFREQCLSVSSMSGITYPKGSKLTWNSLLPGAAPQPCPDGWLLLDDQPFLLRIGAKKACVNSGLTQAGGNFLSGARSSVITGSPNVVNSVLSTLYYVPDQNFNTQSNRGAEFLTIDVNDRGHSGRGNDAILNTTTTFPIFVLAINNPPRIDCSISKLILNEDSGPLAITFFAFVDVDSEEPPGVSILLEMHCSHCTFSAYRDTSIPAIQALTISTRDSFISFRGSLSAVQAMFQSRLVTFASLPDYFGSDIIRTKLNDRGGSGLGNFDDIDSYIKNLPPKLTKQELIGERSLPVDIQPVNDISKLVLADEATNMRLTLSQSGEVAILPFLRQQDTPTTFNHIFVEDVDSDFGISISLACQNGKWKSKTSTIGYQVQGDGRIVSVASGNRTEINVWLKGLNWIADADFLGSEDILVTLTDNVNDTVTGAAPTVLKITIPISVIPIIKCLFNDCKSCNAQKDEKSVCGWCPSACNGQGRCLEATASQSGPFFGICPSASNGQVWMMCEAPAKDLISPIILGYSLTTILAICAAVFFYSYRTNYGSLRSSIRSKMRIARTLARDFNLLPHKDFQFVKVFVIACCGALAIIVPTILGIIPSSGSSEYLTGASMLAIKSDSCDILFKDEPAPVGNVVRLNWNIYQEPAITILTNFCSAKQSLFIVNDRPAANKYQNYFCTLTLFSTANTLFPSLYITAFGSNPTNLHDSFRNAPVLLGPNVLSVDGSWANVKLSRLSAGQILVPSLQRGYINLINVTAMKYKIKTVDAAVFVQTPLAKPARVIATNPYFDFCFIQNAAKLAMTNADRDFQYQLSLCKFECLNATYETGIILPPCGEYVFPNCTDPTTDLYKVPYSHPALKGFAGGNPNISCIYRCGAILPNSDIPSVSLAPAVVTSSNPYDVQISTHTGKITFITVGKLYPPSGNNIQTLMPFPTSPNVSPLDVTLLNAYFHPFGSGTFPSVDIIRIIFVGPGAPPGFFIWSVEPRYLLLPLELLDAASFGLLVPTQTVVQLSVSSTACPPYDPVRGGPDVIAFYSIISRGINNEIIPSSIFAFNDGLNPGMYDRLYYDDSVKSVQIKPLLISGNMLLYALYMLGIAIPATIGVFCSIAMVLKFRSAKSLLVKDACENEARSIHMKAAGSSGMNGEPVEELVTEDMHRRFDCKICVFYVMEYIWTDPDMEQSMITKVQVSVIHCLAVAAVATPMVAFAELYQKSFIANNCPFATNPDNCTSTITAVMYASSTLVKLFPIAAALELVCYNARFSHSFLRRIVYYLFCALFVIVSCVSIACIFGLVLWTTLAVVTSPQKVVPFLIGAICIVAHALRLYPVATSAQEKVRKALLQRSVQVTSRLTGTLPLPLMSNIVNRQVSQHLEMQNLSLRAITRLLVFSVLGLLLVIALLLLSLSAFASAPSILLCIVGSFGVIGAAAIVHRLSVARFRIDDSSLNGMAAASIVSIKKSLDFVLRQMSQAARLLKAMEGNGSSAVADDADGSSSIDRRKTYKQAAQMAIMHDAAARTDRRPPAPPTTRPTPRLWRQRPITRPSMSAPMQLPLPPHVQQQVHAAVSALQAESRWPGVRASGTGISERQIRLGIRTARALAEELPPAAAPPITHMLPRDSSFVEDAFAAGVGRSDSAARLGTSQRLVHTRTARALSSQAASPPSNSTGDFAAFNGNLDHNVAVDTATSLLYQSNSNYPIPPADKPGAYIRRRPVGSSQP